MLDKELPRGVGTVDLEAVMCAAMPLDEPDVVEHRADVQELGVVVQPAALALQGAEGVDAERMVVEQIGLNAANQLGGVARQPAVRDGYGGLNGGHGYAAAFAAAVPCPSLAATRAPSSGSTFVQYSITRA